jgi:type IV pilus assembly protein PilY1
MSKRKPSTLAAHVRRAAAAMALTGLLGWSTSTPAAAPSVSISQVPMTIAIPAHPQIMIAVANSQSMDGTLSGAIMTGAGLYPDMQNSSSPLSFTIPAGFTPPVNAGNGVTAPYTVAGSGVWLDNSPSRLNVAKAGIMSVLSDYIPYADFGLMEYSLPGLASYATSVYLMSPNVSAANPTGSFLFTATQTPIAGVEYVANPCWKYTNSFLSHMSSGDWAYNDCASWDTFYSSQNISQQRWMGIGASSDDPQVNDVLYGLAINCTDYTTAAESYVPSPPNPFTSYSLADYNSNPGNIYEGYSYTTNGCLSGVTPTNAGFVPYSPQVMYLARGFGYYTNQQSGDLNAGQVMVPIGPAHSAGQFPTPASVQAVQNTFWPFLAAETNSAGTGELKAAGVQSPIAGLIAAANNFYVTANPPSTDGCSTSRYVVLLTDGLPTLDSSGQAWPPLGSTSGNSWGVYAAFDPVTGALVDSGTNDQAIIDTVHQLQNLANNHVKTFIIALGAGVDPSVNPLAANTMTAMAVAGGTGQYYPATTPQAVSDALQLIIDTILTSQQSTSSAAVNSTGLNTNSVVFQSQFDSSDVYQDWTGNLFAFPISTTTGIVDTVPADALWSAQTQLDNQSPSERIIATWDPVAQAGTPFEWNTSASTTGISTATVLGHDLESFVPDSSGGDVVSYLRGSSAQEQRSGGAFRNRTHKLGDIVNSNPLYIGAPNGSSQSPSYTTFAAAKATRTPMIYVGADDGMLHAFNATSGNEQFAYVPAGVFANLIDLVSPFYNARHQFFVNGSPQASDVQFADSSWHTVLVSPEQAGGSSIFAIDVTNPAALVTENQLAQTVLWDFTEADMGLTYSTPAIALTSDTAAAWQVFVGNGYNSRFQKPFLYALNAQTGAIVKKIDLCAAVPTACNLSASNGLSTVIAVNSGGQIANAVTLVYAGDLQGNLWRINVSNANPLNWTVSVLFQATDSAGHPQPITTTPVATLNPRFPQVLGTMVFVGTGELLGIPDLGNYQVQTIYGIYDPPSGYATPLNRFNATMVQQSLANESLDGQTVRIVTSNAVSIPTNKGWYIDLDAVSGGTVGVSTSGAVTITGGTVTDQGERVITDPRIESGGAIVLTTYQPTDNLCTAGGSSFLMVLNYATGSSFPSPQFSVNGGVTINSTDSLSLSNAGGSVTLVNPVGLSLGPVYAAAPTIQNANFATASKIKLITESTGAIQSVAEKGSSKNRTAWWEIRQ